MKIDKITITIEHTDEESAKVSIAVDPPVKEGEEVEDTPTVLLGAQVWQLLTAIQHIGHDPVEEVFEEGSTLQ